MVSSYPLLSLPIFALKSPMIVLRSYGRCSVDNRVELCPFPMLPSVDITVTCMKRVFSAAVIILSDPVYCV